MLAFFLVKALELGLGLGLGLLESTLGITSSYFFFGVFPFFNQNLTYRIQYTTNLWPFL